MNLMSEVNIFYNYQEYHINKKNLKHYCQEILSYNKYNLYSVSLIFIDDEELKEMKNLYFKKNLYTDVIAFNLNNENETLDGELYLSIKTIEQNSKLYNASLEQEIKRVVAHGILHLIGYEDNTDYNKQKMTKQEDKLIELFKDIKLIC